MFLASEMDKLLEDLQTSLSMRKEDGRKANSRCKVLSFTAAGQEMPIALFLWLTHVAGDCCDVSVSTMKDVAEVVERT